MITVIATGFEDNDDLAEKKSLANIPAMPFDALAETKDGSNHESEIISEDKSEVETDPILLADDYEYTSHNEDGDNINEPNEPDTSSYDEIIAPD